MHPMRLLRFLVVPQMELERSVAFNWRYHPGSMTLLSGIFKAQRPERLANKLYADAEKRPRLAP